MTTTQQITGREYLRVSRKKGQSCDEQHADNLRSAETHRITISAQPYVDDGFSASKCGRKKRGDFAKLVKDLDSGTFTDDALIIWESSRGSRRVGEWCTLLEDGRTTRSAPAEAGAGIGTTLVDPGVHCEVSST